MPGKSKKSSSKSKPSGPAPCAVLWGLGPDSERGAAVRAVLRGMGLVCRTAMPERLGDPAGAFARLPAMRPSPVPYAGPMPAFSFAASLGPRWRSSALVAARRIASWVPRPLSRMRTAPGPSSASSRPSRPSMRPWREKVPRLPKASLIARRIRAKISPRKAVMGKSSLVTVAESERGRWELAVTPKRKSPRSCGPNRRVRALSLVSVAGMVPVTGQPSKASSSPAGWLSETSRREPYPGVRGRLADVGKCPR